MSDTNKETSSAQEFEKSGVLPSPNGDPVNLPTPKGEKGKKKPFYKRLWFWAVIVAVVAAAVIFGFDSTKMPDVVGMTAKEAKATLKEAGAQKINVIREDGSSVYFFLGQYTVAEQNPEAGTAINSETEITLIVDTGEDTEEETQEEETETEVADAEEEEEEAGEPAVEEESPEEENEEETEEETEEVAAKSRWKLSDQSGEDISVSGDAKSVSITFTNDGAASYLLLYMFHKVAINGKWYSDAYYTTADGGEGFFEGLSLSTKVDDIQYDYFYPDVFVYADSYSVMTITMTDGSDLPSEIKIQYDEQVQDQRYSGAIEKSDYNGYTMTLTYN